MSGMVATAGEEQAWDDADKYKLNDVFEAHGLTVYILIEKNWINWTAQGFGKLQSGKRRWLEANH